MHLINIAIIVISFCCTTAGYAAAGSIEWRLLTSTGVNGDSAGRLLFKTSSSSSWKSVCSADFTATTATRMCNYLGYEASGTTAIVSTVSSSSIYSTGATGLSCTGLTAEATPDNFFSQCEFTAATTCSDNNVHLSCKGARGGASVGNYAGSVYVRVTGPNAATVDRINGVLEARVAHSNTWRSFCAPGVDDSRTAGALCRMMSRTLAIDKIFDYDVSALTTAPSAGYDHLFCSSSIASTFSSCTYTNITATGGKCTGLATSRMGLKCDSKGYRDTLNLFTEIIFIVIILSSVCCGLAFLGCLVWCVCATGVAASQVGGAQSPTNNVHNTQTAYPVATYASPLQQQQQNPNFNVYNGQPVQMVEVQAHQPVVFGQPHQFYGGDSAPPPM